MQPTIFRARQGANPCTVRPSMRTLRLRVLLLTIPLLGAGCYPDPTVEPTWIADLLPRLQCGMTLEEIRALTEREVLDLDGGHQFLGGYAIRTDWHDLWLRFVDNGLRQVTWGAAEDSKNTRLSPRRDLCTNELAFLLDVTWTYDFTGSNVYLDDELVAESTRVPPPLELSTAVHELRIEKPGYAPIVRRYRLTSSDRGDQTLRLSAQDLHRLPKVPAD